MKTYQVTLIATNNQGASVQFTGASKAEALRNFKFVYCPKGWKIEYINSYGKII